MCPLVDADLIADHTTRPRIACPKNRAPSESRAPECCNKTMSKSSTLLEQQPAGSNSNGPDAVRSDRSVAANINSIVSTATNDGPMWQELLKLIADQWDAPYAVVRVVTQRGMVQEESHQNGLTLESWRLCIVPELTYAVSTGLDRSQTFRDNKSEIEISIHTVPVTDQGGRPCGALAIATDAISDVLCDTTRQQLALLVGLCSQAGWDPDLPLPSTRPQSDSKPTRPLDSGSAEQHDVNLAEEFSELETATRQATIAAKFGSIEELSFHVTNSIKTRFNCLEVALGLVRGRRVKLMAISGLDAVYRKTPGAMRISQAMEECLDHGSMVYAQDIPIEADNETPLALPIHQRLRSMTKGSNCVSLTLGSEDSPTAVLTLRRPSDIPFQAAELKELQAQFGAVAEAIGVLRVARRNIFAHFIDDGLAAFSRLLKTTHVRGLTVILLLVVIAGALIKPWHHSIYLEARFSSPKGRIYSAPIDGRIADVHVVPGQHVDKGALLFEIDVEEFQRKLDETHNQARQHRVRMVRALAEYDTTTAAAAKLLLDADEMTIRLLEQRIATAKVYAENPGILVRGEGHLRVGERVPYGEAICHIASDIGREIQLRLEDDQAGDLHTGMNGWFAAKGEPDHKLPIQIVRIERQTAVEDGRNLVAAWARLDENVQTLPLGAEGYARIETGEKPGWWILFHKPLRKLRWYLWPV